MRKSREKENKSLLRVQDYTNDKRKLKTKAIPDYFPWSTAFMLTGLKKGLSFQAKTPSPLPPHPSPPSPLTPLPPPPSPHPGV